MSLAERKRDEVLELRDDLRGELARWAERTGRDEPLQEHHSQVRRLEGLLTKLLGMETQGFAAGQPAALAASTRALDGIASLHRIWGFFRDKLTLREVPWFQPNLALADDFAWACYDPVRAAARSGHPTHTRSLEPPLVFFTQEASPFTLARNTPFAPLGLSADEFAEFGQVLLALPVPVIGLPWPQAQHVPGLVAVGHEVGHILDRDLGLRAEVRANLATVGLPPARLPAWQAWAGEVLADLFGVMAAGQSYALGLMNYLASDEAHQETRVAPSWGDYPTAPLRIGLVLTALRDDVPQPRRAALRARWAAVCPAHPLPEFEADLPAVVEAVLERDLPVFGRSLRRVLSFPAADERSAARYRGDIEARRAFRDGYRARQLVAGAALAFDGDPEGYRRRDAERPIVDDAMAVRPRGLRAGLTRATAAMLSRDQRGARRLHSLLRPRRWKR